MLLNKKLSDYKLWQVLVAICTTQMLYNFMEVFIGASVGLTSGQTHPFIRLGDNTCCMIKGGQNVTSDSGYY